MKTKHLIYLLSMLLGSLLLACSDSNNGSTENKAEEEKSLVEIIKSGKLLVNIEQTATEVTLLFEKETTYKSPKIDIETLEIDKDKWNTIFQFVGSTNLINIPTLGDKLNAKIIEQAVNPTGYAPLSAKLIVELPVDCFVEVEVESTSDTYPSLTHLFTKEYTKRQHLDIHGLYENHKNTVYLHLTDKEGNRRATDKVELTTGQIKFTKPTISLEVSKVERLEKGMTLISYVGDHEYDTSRPFMVDHAGKIRWALDLKSHPELQNFAACTGLKRLRNGNFVTASIRNGMIYELDMFGTLVNSWSLNYPQYDFHRDMIELPNGNFVLAVTKQGSQNKKGEYAILDYMIEVDRGSGAVVTEWDFKQSMEEERSDFTDKFTTSDWAHQNGIAYSEHDNCIIATHRFQGAVKVSWQNETKWILSPHKGWVNKRAYLLEPLTRSGEKLDIEVQQGTKSSNEFDWAWGLHSPYIIDKNRVLFFDNGYYRNFESQTTQAYSRVVEYTINETDRTVKQTWEFGKELGVDGYSSIVSSAQYLKQTNNILFGSGAVGFKGHNQAGEGGGRVLEIDYDTKEILFHLKLQVHQFYIFHKATRMTLYP